MEESPGVMNKISTVPEIKPLDQYDFNRAKICASVRWLLSKSYGSAGTSFRGTVWVGRLIMNPSICGNPRCFIEGNFQHPPAAAAALHARISLCRFHANDEPVLNKSVMLDKRNLLRSMTDSVNAAAQQSLLSESHAPSGLDGGVKLRGEREFTARL